MSIHSYLTPTYVKGFFNLKYRTKTMFQTIMEMIVENPNMSIKEAKAHVLSTTRRYRRSAYKPHYGKQAAARNLRHALSGTHGLHMSCGKIIFGNEL